MTNIAIVTDSSANIPEKLVKENDITIVPMYIGIEGKMYKEGKEIESKEIYEALEKDLKVHTSGPSAGDFLKVFKYLIEKKKKDLIYCISLSSKLSSAFNAVNLAKMNFPKNKIKIFDSKNSTISLGLIALGAVRAARDGKSEEEIDSLIEFLIKRSKFFAVLENFKYVFRGGRAPFLGKFLSAAIRFKPILTIGKNGKVQLKGSAKNRKSAIYKIYGQIKKEASCKGKKKIGIFYGSDISPALELKKMIEGDSDIDIDELILTEITAIMSAHTGPGIWGAAVCPKV